MCNLPDGCEQRFDRIDEKLEAIHAQASKTNGRVTKLEKWSLVFITALVVVLATNPSGLLTVLETVASWVRWLLLQSTCYNVPMNSAS